MFLYVRGVFFVGNLDFLLLLLRISKSMLFFYVFRGVFGEFDFYVFLVSIFIRMIIMFMRMIIMFMRMFIMFMRVIFFLIFSTFNSQTNPMSMSMIMPMPQPMSFMTMTMPMSVTMSMTMTMQRKGHY